MEHLLGTACQRIIRYEALPEDTEEASILFLNEDISTVPERHAFLGNYRRFCHNVVEIIAQRRPLEALQYIVSQAETEVSRFASRDETFEPSTYRRDTLTILYVDAHFTVVEAAVRGFSKWVSVNGKHPQEDDQKRVTIEILLEEWTTSLLSRTFHNPMMKQRVIKLAIELSTRGLERNQSFALRVLEHILVSQPSDRPEYPAYSEAVKELHVFAANELRKLGQKNADYFSTFYDQLEAKVNDILSSTALDEKPQSELTGLLFIVMQRASNVDPELRWKKLVSFIDPLMQSWQDPDLTTSLSSFEGFCNLLEIDKVAAYMQTREATRIEDWSSTPLDEEGTYLQASMTDRFQRAVPLRISKTMLAVATENLKIGSEPYQLACELWRERIPIMLPNILSLVKHAHTFHAHSTWSTHPVELQQVFRRILTDRFWQAGISVGTKDQFYAKITSTKATLEGFASSVRGKLRAIRETCYSLLFCMSRLGDFFYGYEQLAQPLADALFGTAGSLSSHQFSVLLNMSRYLIDDCPIRYRETFLPPLLTTLFTQLDQNITAEWERILNKRSKNAAEDDLTEEMKEESVLRQFTYNAIMLVTSILDPNRDANEKNYTSGHHSVSHHQRRKSSISRSEQNNDGAGKGSTLLRTFVLSHASILEPILLFSTHALRIQDARSASIITRVIRSIVPNFSQPDFISGISPEVALVIREFIGDTVLRETITSLHDPYFVDLQKDLAQLIATIWTCYGIPYDSGEQALSQTPQAVISSLPGMTEERVQRATHRLAHTGSMRQQRACILELLESLRGVSINEMGKINPTRGSTKTIVQKRYTTNDNEGVGGMDGVDQQVEPVNVDDGPDLEGIAEIFG
ncbi:putative nuclear import and export protein [Phaeomoniella chlamydospora]|uniref:Putative nuclear import and export protein n=1 Tax=Phaeomoniella chlamydospora TaxID=158046 RepID=A0A0G2GT09_PHACM|nr:putative nuclear import and export protein [Phaeomoniella chlamydospora]